MVPYLWDERVAIRILLNDYEMASNDSLVEFIKDDADHLVAPATRMNRGLFGTCKR